MYTLKKSFVKTNRALGQCSTCTQHSTEFILPSTMGKKLPKKIVFQ